MKLRSAIAAAAVVGLALSGCGSDDGEDTSSGIETPAADATGTLKVWVMPDTLKSITDATTAKFNEAYPNVTVSVETQQWSGIQDKLTTSLGTDSTPDVVEIGNSPHGEVHRFRPSRGPAASQGFDIEGMLPGLQPSGEYDGSRAGDPAATAASASWSTRRATSPRRASPRSRPRWPSSGTLPRSCRRPTASNPNYSAFYFPGKYWYGAVPFVWDAGGDIATEDGGTWTGTLNGADSQAGLATLKDLVDNYSKAPKDGDEAKNTDAFNTGNVGMMIDSWWAPDALDAPGKPFAGDIGAFAMPGTEPGTTSPVFFGGSDMAISEKSANKGLAVEYLKILTGLEIQTQFAQGRRHHPQPGGGVRRPRGQAVPPDRR